MKKPTNESLTKNSANLDEIVNNVDEFDELFKSRDFITALIDDLRNNKRNVTSWKLVDGNGRAEDMDSFSMRDAFGVEYSFDFNYKYNGQEIPLTIFINGEVDVNRVPYNSGSWTQPPEGGNSEVDYKNLGSSLSLALYDKDGGEIDISWLTPKLIADVTKQILKDYV